MPEPHNEAVGDATAEAVPDNDNVLAGCITRAQLLDQLSIHDATLRRWHRKGEGPPRIVLGAREYYAVDAVRKWVLSRTQTNGAGGGK